MVYYSFPFCFKLLTRRYAYFSGIAIEPILGVLSGVLPYSHRKNRTKSSAEKNPVLLMFNVLFADRAVSFVGKHSFLCIQNVTSGSLCSSWGLYQAFRVRERPRVRNLSFSRSGKCEYEMCLVSTWKAGIFYQCCVLGC